MGVIDKKYLIKTKISKMIIFMRGGILSFITNRSAKNEQISKTNTQNRFLQFYPDG